MKTYSPEERRALADIIAERGTIDGRPARLVSIATNCPMIRPTDGSIGHSATYYWETIEQVCTKRNARFRS